MPLWVHLLALVLVPLVGVLALTAVIVRTAVSEARTAERAEAAVQAVAQLDAARSGIEHEIVPVLSVAVLSDPAFSAAVGISPLQAQVQLVNVERTRDEAQVLTDLALAAVPAGSPGAASVELAAGRLADLRAGSAAQQAAPQDTYAGYFAVSGMLMDAQQAAAASTTGEDVSIGTYEAAHDVALVARAARTASRMIPLYVGTQLPLGGAEGGQAGWHAAWQDYLDAKRGLDQLATPGAAAAWEVVRNSLAVVQVDAQLAEQHAAGTAAPLAQVVSLVSQSTVRDAAYTDLLDSAVGTARAAAAADRDAATDRRTRTLLAGLGVLLVAGLAVGLLGRSVTRSLRVLAGQAVRVSRGELVEVGSGGPREVRTVSAALDSAVASLRRIQDQARAVARGDLSNALLDEPLPGPLGEVVHASVRQIVSSVRQREELQSALAHQASHDPLTELPNRAQALQLTAAALSRGQRSGSMTGLLFVDLDGFKAVNDSLGHAAGDDVLCEVAVRLRDAVRAGDVVCRLGGDEFVVLVEGVDDERTLVELAERLIDAVSGPLLVGGQPASVGASVGVAVSRDGVTDPDVLLVEADTAAYRAKRHGRGRAEVFDEALRAQLAERAALEAAIAAGLAGGEMVLHYQPVIDVAGSRLTGYEALVRWERPGHGMVPPDLFIPAAEESRLICELDRWVLHEATRQLAEWRADAGVADGEPEPTIAVNISGRHLADRRVVADVADALAASGLPAHLLVLEVTETVLVDDPSAIDNLAALRALGAAIAIDDFGTGYTSIGQLRHMPVDTLKIDRSFIASGEPGHGELVALMIRAAHTFGMTVVAEGVEEPAQLARLRAESCDQAQGYLLHRPLPAAAAGALLQARHPVAGPA
ncbi:bifunctional diguanylate cyclase/phosphodiesterase [uncultured Modestobacter sp.]|uniref:putative bifunctional diguanylate cyclase/phosphodiesterase n=1 Tax=uncultured Modestobacter sp. TaxID=380048 RepID=UPI00261CE2B5|nr:EAL domain-containing protein [uncultured Modestobacter sp.]